MIQRVQSIYLGLVFILIGVMSFLPVVQFTAGDVEFSMNIFRFAGADGFSFASQLPDIWPLPIFAALLGVLAGVSLFRYNNRKQQMTINMIAMLMNFALLAGIFLFAEAVCLLPEVGEKPIYDIAAFFPIVTVLLLILANRNIRKDEKLIRESDRLR